MLRAKRFAADSKRRVLLKMPQPNATWSSSFQANVSLRFAPKPPKRPLCWTRTRRWFVATTSQ